MSIMRCADHSRRFRLCFGMVLLLLASCGGGGGSSGSTGVAAQRGDLVTVASSATLDPATVRFYIDALATYAVNIAPLRRSPYPVVLSVVVYKTITPDGRLIDASGLLAYPVKVPGQASPMLSFQHGTIFQDQDAPSISSSYDAALVALAGSGFVVAAPDYTGYASSTGEIHPYVHAAGLSASIVDMLRATRRVLGNNGVSANGQLFLTGYSEGGYATLAAQKEIEQRHRGEFTVTASMPAAGPYNMSATATYMVGLDSNPYPEFLGFVFKSYDHWYRWGRLGGIFQSPYDVIVDTYYDGSQSGGGIHAALPADATTLFGPDFRAAFLGSGETAVKRDIARNDIHAWTATAPTRLFHGADDTIVPYFNAIDAQAGMTAANSSSVTVVDCTTPAPIPRGHAECVWDYLTQVFDWFLPLASDL